MTTENLYDPSLQNVKEELDSLLKEDKILKLGKKLFYVAEERVIPYSKKVDVNYLIRHKEKEGLALRCESLELWARLSILELEFQRIMELAEQ